MNTPTTPTSPILSGDYGTPVSQIALGAQKTPDARAEMSEPFSALTDDSVSDDGTEASGATKINNFASSELFDTDKPQKALGKIRFIMHHIDESIQNMMSKFDDKGNYTGGTRTRQYTRQNKRHRQNKRSRRQ